MGSSAFYPPIRPDPDGHMASIRQWLAETEAVPLEEMAAFFRARLSDYEPHMSVWAAAYEKMAELLPQDVRDLLDFGAGTGLELDAIAKTRSGLRITCVDLSSDMLAALHSKHPEATIVCGDYFTAQLPAESFDAVIAFETLHHFTPAQKRLLFQRILGFLRPGGLFMEADYIACCDEEETLLSDVCRKKRAAQGIPDDTYVHFDTPLTAAHEAELLEEAGFSEISVPAVVDGACFLLARKPRAARP